MATKVNKELNKLYSIESGSVLLDGYTVEKELPEEGGEASLYICKKSGKKYIAKIYGRQYATKEEVVEKLGAIDSPYVVKIVATGQYNGLPVEILPYYKNGSLKGKKFGYDDLRKTVIPQLNEGLRAIHESGILHRDIKPANIMLCDNGKDISIIDFGVSSVRGNGQSIVVTKIGMTPEYAAPETRINMYLTESDYYSLGITIYELFTGNLPYAGLSEEERLRLVAVQRVPIPDSFPEHLRRLILALTYTDIQNRNDKTNPNRRWTYEEVKKWCAGEEQPIPGESKQNRQPTNATADELSSDWREPYRFLQKKYYTAKDLVFALGANWEEGKKTLFRSYLSAFFKDVAHAYDLAGCCEDAEKENKSKPENGDLIFFRTLYRIDPKLTSLVWKGKVFKTLKQLGEELLKGLWNDDKSIVSCSADMLMNGVLSAYAEEQKNKDDNVKNALLGLEREYRLLDKDSEESRARFFYKMAYMLSQKKAIKIGEEIASFDEKKGEGNIVNAVAKVLEDNFQEGKKLVASGIAAEFLRTFNSSIASDCDETEEKMRRRPNDTDLLFYQFLHEMDSNLPLVFYKGKKYKTLFDINKRGGMNKDDLADILQTKTLSTLLYWRGEQQKSEQMKKDAELVGEIENVCSGAYGNTNHTTWYFRHEQLAVDLFQRLFADKRVSNEYSGFQSMDTLYRSLLDEGENRSSFYDSFKRMSKDKAFWLLAILDNCRGLRLDVLKVLKNLSDNCEDWSLVANAFFDIGEATIEDGQLLRALRHLYVEYGPLSVAYWFSKYFGEFYETTPKGKRGLTAVIDENLPIESNRGKMALARENIDELANRFAINGYNLLIADTDAADEYIVKPLKKKSLFVSTQNYGKVPVAYLEYMEERIDLETEVPNLGIEAREATLTLNDRISVAKTVADINSPYSFSWWKPILFALIIACLVLVIIISPRIPLLPFLRDNTGNGYDVAIKYMINKWPIVVALIGALIVPIMLFIKSVAENKKALDIARLKKPATDVISNTKKALTGIERKANDARNDVINHRWKNFEKKVLIGRGDRLPTKSQIDSVLNNGPDFESAANSAGIFAIWLLTLYLLCLFDTIFFSYLRAMDAAPVFWTILLAIAEVAYFVLIGTGLFDDWDELSESLISLFVAAGLVVTSVVAGSGFLRVVTLIMAGSIFHGIIAVVFYGAITIGLCLGAETLRDSF